MKTIVAIFIALMTLQVLASPPLSPEEMYGSYDKDGKYRAMQEQLDQMNQQIAKAEKEKSEKQTIALWAAIAISLIPLGVIAKQIIGKRTWEDNPRGTLQSLAIGLAGAAVLFGLNYGVLLLKIEYGSSFNTAFAVVIVLFLIGVAIYAVRKKDVKK